MFIHSTRLPHVLTPDRYCSAEQHAREMEALLRPAWHLAATTGELAQPGDFATFDLLGQPLLVSNLGGRWQACSNVSADGRRALTAATSGHDRSLCSRANESLEAFRVEQCGQLLFVCLDQSAPPLAEWLGDCDATLAAAAGAGWWRVWSDRIELEANWKVPLENSVESYHIPAVHPQTFKDTPPAERVTHVLRPTWTSFHVTRAASSWIERLLFTLDDWLLVWLGRTPSCGYTHYHVFPNLMLSSTDTTSLFISSTPLGPQRCRATIRMFAYDGATSRWPTRQICRTWGQFNRALAQRILAEDFRIYPSIQRGLAASPHRGCLGVIEERIYAFQQYVDERCSRASAGAMPTLRGHADRA